jgi:aryl-alcohol dehydrogenase-like predicted oxidoreductase
MRVGLGCVALGSGAGRRVADDVRLVRAAIDLGVTVFDTADAYGAGASERVLGRAVKGRRDEVVIATKGGFDFRARHLAEQWARRWYKAVVPSGRKTQASAPAAAQSRSSSYDHQDFSPRHLRDAVHASLRRLDTDRIDVYQLHGPAEVFPDLLDQLSDLVTVGDVGQFGVGAQAVALADRWILMPGISVVQVPFGVLDPEAASTTFPLARLHGREVWVRAIFGGGLLSLADRDPAALTSDRKWNLVRELRRIAADAGLDQYQLACGFVRAHGDVSTVLVGTTSLTHMRRNTELLAGPALDDGAVRAVLEAVAASDAQERA